MRRKVEDQKWSEEETGRIEELEEGSKGDKNGEKRKIMVDDMECAKRKKRRKTKDYERKERMQHNEEREMREGKRKGENEKKNIKGKDMRRDWENKDTR